MLTADFAFDLPRRAIAQRPLPRGTARLLVLDEAGAARHRAVGDFPALLRPGDLVIANDTRVIPARLFARPVAATTGARVELLLAERLDATRWTALVKPGRRARPGARLSLEHGLEASVEATTDDGRRVIRFDQPIEPHLDRLGHVPLPPYIERADGTDDAADRAQYQTIFARAPGAIAAPTAGLHFTAEMGATLQARGIQLSFVTLHVGIGTFKPVTAHLLHEHRMESERFEIPPATADAIQQAKHEGRRVVAIGTTVVRTLEGAALLSGGLPLAGSGATDLFIRPGFRFLVVDGLLTNFHLPRSTLLVLVSAFAGRQRVLAAYGEAIAAGYRFYSYGDAMFAWHAARMRCASTAAP
jgi:S-adenosylmethionine:tRNA ribosyltransferase-isomerase